MIHAKYLLALSVMMGFFYSCDYNRPDEPTSTENSRYPLSSATTTVAQLKDLYRGRPTTITEDIVVEATIVSDDTEGNLYRTAYLQDATGGLELRLALGNLSTIYPQGSVVQLHARGMTLGRYGGQINLGYKSTNERYETGFYPEHLVGQVLRFKATGKVEPIALSIANLSLRYNGQLIKIQDVQFVASDLGQTYAAPQNKVNQSNVNRTLIDKNGRTVIVRTSSYARFAGRELPQGSGSITAVLTYFNSTPQLILLKEKDAALTGERF